MRVVTDLACALEHVRDVVNHAASLLAVYAPGYAAALHALPAAVDGPSFCAWRAALVDAREAWHVSPGYASEREALSAATDGGTVRSVCAALDVLAIEAGWAIVAEEIGDAFFLALEACDSRPSRMCFLRERRRAAARPVALR